MNQVQCRHFSSLLLLPAALQLIEIWLVGREVALPARSLISLVSTDGHFNCSPQIELDIMCECRRRRRRRVEIPNVAIQSPMLALRFRQFRQYNKVRSEFRPFHLITFFRSSRADLHTEFEYTDFVCTAD